MAKNITVAGKKAERIETTRRALPRIEPSEFAAGLGAEPCGTATPGKGDPISLAAIGHELIKRLRSTGGRPALANATEKCKVPLNPEEIAALERIVGAIEGSTGTRPSMGQLASVILSMHLNQLNDAARGRGRASQRKSGRTTLPKVTSLNRPSK